MADCRLVGDLDLGIDGCVVSVDVSCSTDIVLACGEEVKEGASIQTISLSAFAGTVVWAEAPSKAGVSIPFVQKYDCEEDIMHFIFSGEGKSFYTSAANQLVDLHHVFPTECTSYSASSSSGPATVYLLDTQVNGYGMTYKGGPLSFSTSAEGTLISVGDLGACYLQNFSLNAQPGQIPTVSYSFVRPLSMLG